MGPRENCRVGFGSCLPCERLSFQRERSYVVVHTAAAHSPPGCIQCLSTPRLVAATWCVCGCVRVYVCVWQCVLFQPYERVDARRAADAPAFMCGWRLEARGAQAHAPPATAKRMLAEELSTADSLSHTPAGDAPRAP